MSLKNAGFTQPLEGQHYFSLQRRQGVETRIGKGSGAGSSPKGASVLPCTLSTSTRTNATQFSHSGIAAVPMRIHKSAARVHERFFLPDKVHVKGGNGQDQGAPGRTARHELTDVELVSTRFFIERSFQSARSVSCTRPMSLNRWASQRERPEPGGLAQRLFLIESACDGYFGDPFRKEHQR
jgi:hypothetical protein